MSITGLPGQGPVRVGIPIADLSSGMYAAMGALIALLEREVSGEGQWVQTSLLQAQISMLDFQAARWTVGARGAGPGRQRPPDRHPDRRVPDQRRAHQHRRLRPAHLRALCKALGAERLIDDPDFANGDKRSQEPQAAQRGDRRVHQALHAAPSWWRSSTPRACRRGPIYAVDQMFADPQVKHVGMAVPMQHPTRGQVAIVNQAVALSRTPSRASTARRRRWASIPRRCWASSATARTTSPICGAEGGVVRQLRLSARRFSSTGWAARSSAAWPADRRTAPG